ncbi:MAG: PEP-CTERM sorting domain-containing protein [Terriglobia bacterium]
MESRRDQFYGSDARFHTTDLAGGFGLTATSNWSAQSGPPPSPTPEPPSILLLGAGLLALLWVARRTWHSGQHAARF